LRSNTRDFRTAAPDFERSRQRIEPSCSRNRGPGARGGIDFYNGVERRICSGGQLVDLRDVAGKIAEQAARIAAVLALVDDPNVLEIDGDAMIRACTLAEFYLQEAARLSGEARVPQDQADGELIWKWLQDRNLSTIKAIDLQKSGPGPLRKKERLDPAIAFLQADGRLKPIPDVKGWAVVGKNRS
jgi:hypothetical protein